MMKTYSLPSRWRRYFILKVVSYIKGHWLALWVNHMTLDLGGPEFKPTLGIEFKKAISSSKLRAFFFFLRK